MSDHHTDVSFAEFVRCAGAVFPRPSVGPFRDALLGAHSDVGLLLNLVAWDSIIEEYFDTNTRGRVPFVIFGWIAFFGRRLVFVIICDMGALEDSDGRHSMVGLDREC